MIINKLKHLYSRTCFGYNIKDFKNFDDKNLIKNIDKILNQSKNRDFINIIEKSEAMKYAEAYRPKNKMTAPESESISKKEAQMYFNEKRKDMMIGWMQKMIVTDNPFLENVTLFWHGHFACRANNPYFDQQLHNIIKEHATGNFRDLIMKVSQSPAMLGFLNNQQNKKGHPNENFAREVMELFALGIGHYSENDIKEAARAFTGWKFSPEGEFVFNEKQHDTGSKTFLGKTGNFNGEDIINIIVDQPQCAQHIAGKIYQYFVNDTPDQEIIKSLGEYFYQKNYDIHALLKKIFTADWFYQKQNIGNKIKSPTQFIVQISRNFGIEYKNPKNFLLMQRGLGQILFNPPNVAGWPGGKSWIDSSSLLLRMHLSSLLLTSGILNFDPKIDPDDEANINFKNMNSKKTAFDIETTVDWEVFNNTFNKNNLQQMSDFVLQTPLNQEEVKIASEALSVKNTLISLACLPEYQLY